MLEKLLNSDDSAIVKNSKCKLLVIALVCTFLILMGIPQLHLGYLRAGKITLTLMHIPVLAAVFLTGLPGAVVSSLVFGIISLISSLAGNGGVLSEFLKNPVYSVFPRLLFGAIAWFVFCAINKRISVYIEVAVSAFTASFFQSFLVIGAIYVFSHERAIKVFKNAGYFELMQKLIPGILLEALAATVILIVLTFLYNIIVKPCEGGN